MNINTELMSEDMKDFLDFCLSKNLNIICTGVHPEENNLFIYLKEKYNLNYKIIEDIRETNLDASVYDNHILGAICSHSTQDAITRIAIQYSQDDFYKSLKEICSLFHIYVCVEELPGNTKRVIRIDFVDGVDESGNPKIENLFYFKFRGHVKTEDGIIVGTLGEIKKSDFDFSKIK